MNKDMGGFREEGQCDQREGAGAIERALQAVLKNFIAVVHVFT